MQIAIISILLKLSYRDLVVVKENQMKRIMQNLLLTINNTAEDVEVNMNKDQYPRRKQYCLSLTVAAP